MASNDPALLIDAVSPPTTLFAPGDTILGASTPAENVPVWDFDADADRYMDFYGTMSPGYGGGGLTLTLPWSASSATSGNTIWGAAIRRIADDAEDLDSTAHTYDYNAVTDAPASAVGEVVYPTITFTNGVDMDSLVAGERFILRIRRDADNGSDTMAGDAELHFPNGKES